VHGDCHCHGFVRGRRTTPCNAPSSYRTCQSSKSILRLSERLSPSVWQTPSLRREQQQTTDALGMNGPKSDENGLPSRKIVFAVDGTTDAEEGLRWVVKEIARKGEVNCLGWGLPLQSELRFKVKNISTSLLQFLHVYHVQVTPYTWRMLSAILGRLLLL
jgi:hypothetical protein